MSWFVRHYQNVEHTHRQTSLQSPQRRRLYAVLRCRRPRVRAFYCDSRWDSRRRCRMESERWERKWLIMDMQRNWCSYVCSMCCIHMYALYVCLHVYMSVFVSNIYLLCDKNLPVEWPEPSQPGMGHLQWNERMRLG